MSPKSTPTASPAFAPPFDHPAACALLRSRAVNEVQVVRAAPGHGKSTHFRDAIVDAMNAGDLQRVLWSTQSIATIAPLGEEAREHFVRRGIPADIVYSRKDHKTLGGPGSYQDQFNWAVQPAVKIIAHARIRQVFTENKSSSVRLKKAVDLLVIDEDPTASLLLTSPTQGSASEQRPYRLSELTRSGDPVMVALARILTGLDAETALTQFELPNGFQIGHGLHGQRFWTQFHRAHPGPVDVTSLSAALKKAKMPGAGFMAEAFAEDARLSAGPTAACRSRFGLHWSGKLDPAKLTEQALFRFNLRQPLKLDLPVVVLDGYADDELYTALFAEQRVHLRPFERGLQLDVEFSPLLHIDALRNGQTVGTEHRRHVADELAQQRLHQKAADPDSRQLTITSKKLLLPASEWQVLLQKAYHAQSLTVCAVNSPDGTPTDLHQRYWHSGRGRNMDTGANVYALHLPGLSTMNRDYTLSAVLPDQPASRERLQTHALGAELLQMFNRGRQPVCAAMGKPVPRIVVAAAEKHVLELLGPLSDRVVLRPFKPLLSLMANSKSPRWRDMMAALARELLVHFPAGLPIALLEALPKHSKAARRLDIQAKLRALALTQPTDTHLYRAFRDPDLWMYSSVPSAGKEPKSSMLNEAMASLGLTPRQEPETRGRPQVYLPAGGDARVAGDAYRKWLTT